MKKRIQLRKKTGKNREWKAVADYRKWKKSLKKKKELWKYLKDTDAELYKELRTTLFGITFNLHGPTGRWFARTGYRVFQKLFGFN